MTDMVTSEHENPSPGGHEIFNCRRPSHGHHYFIFTLSDLCLGVGLIFQEIMHVHDMTDMARPQQENHSWGHNIYEFGGLFHGHIFFLNYFVWSMSRSREEVSLRNISSSHFLPQSYIPLGEKGGIDGFWNRQRLISLPYRSYIPNFFKIDQ